MFPAKVHGCTVSDFYPVRTEAVCYLARGLNLNLKFDFYGTVTAWYVGMHQKKY